MKINVYRKFSNDKCTMGYMYVDGNPICYTLELPWKDNQQSISCVPEGTYQAFLRYDKSDKWRIQLTGVEGRSGIQIHVGNWPSQIKGCVLVGMGANPNTPAVIKSVDAYNKLKSTFYGSASPNQSPATVITVAFSL